MNDAPVIAKQDSWASAGVETPLRYGWTVRARTLAELFHEVELIAWKMALEPEVYVIFSKKRSNRFVQMVIDDEDHPGDYWCETVDDRFLGYPKTGPKHSPVQLEALLRNRWNPSTGIPGKTPNWHRVIPATSFGAPSLVSQLVVSTLIDVHNVRDPQQVAVKVGAR